MKKINIKLVSVIIVISLFTVITFFYACNKDQNNNITSNPKAEIEFFAKKQDGTCLKVEVYRDKKNNAQISTKVDENKENIDFGLYIPESLNIKPEQSKDNDSLVIIIPSDAIYWLVPIDNQTPIKFDPINSTKVSSGSGTVRPQCECWEGTTLNDNCCEARWTDLGYICSKKNDTCGCTNCRIKVTARSGTIETTIFGSCYLIKSNTITVNGVIYE
ncbi:MAG: hypothetical protein CVU04_03180 [Bacteroidetes bacterium HGW-Bacteroidetes-20]|nr:MAG: hypothetical protein CVU04_03180 [Bacteroidetes bacterium HGW-Bacteroidetes-20]